MITLSAQPALCYTCHGADGAGSQLNVAMGRQYGPGAGGATGFLGALRGGGFQYALLGTPSARTGFGPGKGTIPALSGSVLTTSHHSNDFSDQEIWGNGDINSSTVVTGTSTELRCGSCHNPHGEYSYRILRAVPVDSGATSGTTCAATSTCTAVLIPDVRQWTQSGISAPVGVLPSGAAYGYMTTNYWVPWDTNWYGLNYMPDGTPPSSAVCTNPTSGTCGNQEQLEWSALTTKWCTLCHTRYLAPSGAYETSSTDKVFTYRHPTYGADVTLSRDTSGNFSYATYNTAMSVFTGSSIPACMQCHVAHGSNASMGTYSGAIPLPGGSANTTVETSRLLRVDNRGVCQMCHFK
jgi:hypothetical protein